MSIFKNKYLQALLLIISLLGVFFGGAVFGGRVSDSYLAKKFNEANMPVILSHYKSYRNIARAIELQNHDMAKCHAQLGASVMFDALRACVDDINCKNIIEKRIREDAPEVEGKLPMGFEYMQTKKGIKSCN